MEETSRRTGLLVGAVVAAATVFVLFFFLFPAPFVAQAGSAALALFP